jgi:outer membrane protein assembly factor BamB
MPSPSSRSTGRRVLIAAAAAAVILGVAAAVVVLHSPGNVSHPNLSFTKPTSTAVPDGPSRRAASFQWPMFGFDAARTRFFEGGPRPPFTVRWHFFDGALLEFPPVLDGDRLFVLDDDATAREIDARNGHVIWERGLGTLAASSPAIDRRQGLVVFTVLSRTPGAHLPGNGAVYALSMDTGRVLWSRPLEPGSESSPLVWGKTVYLGDQGGDVYSLNATNGHVNWVFHAAGAVKGGIARSGGVLYFGDYSGHVYALSASNGHELWSSGPQGAQLGFSSGTFYSTPAVAFGRVYIGNTDGFVYSFAAHTGQLAWSRETGDYVYASPAVADLPGIGPTVYIGSYSGEFFALNAASGAVRWEHPAGGRISGSASVIGDVVYYSDLGTKTTTGLDARTGRVVFSFHDGAFTPAIADYGALYLDGYDTLYELVPRRSRQAAADARNRSPSSSANRRGRSHSAARRRSRG